MTADDWFDGISPSLSNPPEIDTSVPHPARVYDYWLGGKDNFAPDRAAAEQALRAFPQTVASVRANRAFLARAVRFLAAEAGIRQFLDIGTGLPSADNTHEVAQAVAPAARIVYVDNDPIVLVHARALLTSTTGTTAYVQADLRDTGLILEAAGRTLDLAQPVAILLLGVLHFIPDGDDPYGVVARLLAAAAAGSYLALSHTTADGYPEVAEFTRLMNAQHPDTPVTPRSRADVARFFSGLALVDPGLVTCAQWRPRDAAEAAAPAALWAGVGRKP